MHPAVCQWYDPLFSCTEFCHCFCYPHDFSCELYSIVWKVILFLFILYLRKTAMSVRIWCKFKCREILWEKDIHSLWFTLTFYFLVVFQDEEKTGDSFLVRVFKLVLNVIAVLLLAGGISSLIKVHRAVLIFVNNRIIGSDWSRLVV